MDNINGGPCTDTTPCTVIDFANFDDGTSACAKFFDRPVELKQKAPHPPEGWKHRGYTGIGVERGFHADKIAMVHSQVLDFKESFDFGNDSEPARLQNMSKLLPALALGIPGVPEGFFHEYHQEADNQVRLLHYPAAPAESFLNGEKGRINAHTDFGTCTVLFQDDCGRLEVKSPYEPGKFISVPPIPGTVVFNIADFLMRWSNDTLKSTLHRVRVPPQSLNGGGIIKERFSIPFFIGADHKKTVDLVSLVPSTVDCLPGCFGPDGPKKYDPVNVGQYINMRLNAIH
ncbi:flavonol synthase/flavanone 3-hydroxylase [Hygrophoropsis aurantiaca]|uniref:Flavonol synthase/flavanone 3-hydroxylase n=1 Tax=Hygrophoropsis aurantiaca TaxID=72124 RepID=A0ACB7ZX34_9AGAM|nr:flavonol synthase/flavanone 3-hydroxylase [Hygrophoropsis aurantiaca]